MHIFFQNIRYLMVWGCLFQGLRLMFLPNVPGAMFIQGGTFIPESRVTQTVVEMINIHVISVQQKR